MLCEKPLAASAAAALRIVEAERPLGRRLVTVGFMRRFDPGYVDLKARLDAGEIGAPLLHALRAPQPERPRLLRLGDDHHRQRGARDRRRALAARGGDRARDRAAPRPDGARGTARPAAAAARDRAGRLVDVEAFVSAGYGYDIRCEVVGEDGTLELLPPATVALRTAARERLGALRLPRERLRRRRRRGRRGPTAWDGYAAALARRRSGREPGARSTCSSDVLPHRELGLKASDDADDVLGRNILASPR